MNDVLEGRQGETLQGNVVYDLFSDWCKESGVYAEGKKTFFQLLRGRGILQTTGTIDGKTMRNVVKVPLNPETSIPEEWR